MPNYTRLSVENTGCEASPSCLRCPLPVCRYDMPEGYLNAHTRLMRDARLMASYRESPLSLEEFAQAEGVVPRTMYRVMARYEVTELELQEMARSLGI